VKIRPTRQHLLVKLHKPEEKSAGGIVILDAVAEKMRKESDMAEVVAVGQGKMLEDGSVLAPCAAPRDVVVLYRGSGHSVTVDGEELRMVHESEVLGVVVFDVNPSLGGEERVSPEGSGAWRI
jgi:chaperonin GroES